MSDMADCCGVCCICCACFSLCGRSCPHILGKWGKWGKKNKEDEEFVAEVEREAAFYGPSQNQYAPSYPMHVTHQPQEPEPGFSLQQSTTEYTPADASYTPKKPSPQ